MVFLIKNWLLGLKCFVIPIFSGVGVCFQYPIAFASLKVGELLSGRLLVVMNT